MHNDSVDPSNAGEAGATAIVASAKARNIPVVTAKQMLDWLDGRNGSSFQNVVWSGNVLSFTVAVAAGASGLQAMVPANRGLEPDYGSAAERLDGHVHDQGDQRRSVRDLCLRVRARIRSATERIRSRRAISGDWSSANVNDGGRHVDDE